MVYKTMKTQQKFPKLFKGLGKLSSRRESVNTPRRVPIPLLLPVKKELQRMEKLGVISTMEAPTDWCAGMVVTSKKGGKVRICVDLTNLN